MLAFPSKCYRGVILNNGRNLLSTAAIRVSDDVKNAILSGAPIVALESTIISHGMPYPRNLEVAKLVEQTVRDFGAVPATIAIIEGVPKVGLSEKDLLVLASNHTSKSVMKASTKDLAYVYATKANASTTVASTMRLASLAGIDVFATGGIGGVHRGAESSLDVSADLTELSRTPVTVICAGVKSILDIPKTLEVLETNSVPVVSYGCEEFPAFYTNESGIKSLKVQSAAEVAAMMQFSKRMHLPSGMVVAVPNPDPASSEKINYAINFALNSAKNEGITGAEITPYILSKIEQLTDGASLDSNVSLIVNNAKVAAQVAAEYRKLMSESEIESDCKGKVPLSHFFPASSASAVNTTIPLSDTPADAPTAMDATTEPSIDTSTITDTVAGDSDAEDTSSTVDERNKVLVVGGALIDIVGKISTLTRMGSSNPGTMHTTFGGVGYNIASVLSSLGGRVILATAIGDDINGKSLLHSSAKAGMDTSHVRIVPLTNEGADSSRTLAHTAMYNAIHDSTGDIVLACADTNIFSHIDPYYIKSLVDTVQESAVVVVDGNIHTDSLAVLVNICKHFEVPVMFEPTSDHKCLAPFLANVFSKLDVVKPNLTELVQMTNYCLQHDLINSGRAQVANTLSHIVADRVDGIQEGNSLDEVDIRVLTRALYQQMLAADPTPNRGPTPQRSESRRAVTGKHIIVSMGHRGLLWCGPQQCICDTSGAAGSGDAAHSSLLQNMVIDEDTNSATCLIPVSTVEPSLIKNTNGAGDALMGGIIAEMMTQLQSQSQSQSALHLPNQQCIRAGLMAAHSRLISD